MAARKPTPTAMLGSESKEERLRSLSPMNSEGLSGPKMKRVEKSARGVYRWLWFSLLLTIPTLAVLLFSDTPISIAVMGSALWHLLLLRQALAKHPYVRWHGRQGLLLAALRTAVPLGFGLLFNNEEGILLAFWLLIAIWLAGNIWVQNQVARGDCWLMRVRGQGEGLPLKWPDNIQAASPAASARSQPSVERGMALLSEGHRGAAAAEFLAAFQAGDATSRGRAFEQLKSMGEVEVF